MGQRAKTPEELDPRGVIAESYRIEGIGAAECRSIFLDWAIGVPAGTDARSLIPELLALYGESAPDHPMTRVLTEGLAAPDRSGPRGGWAGRRR